MGSWGYWLNAAWIVILALYLSNAFERIKKIEERLDKRDEK
jgi:hypothetical protein